MNPENTQRAAGKTAIQAVAFLALAALVFAGASLAEMRTLEEDSLANVSASTGISLQGGFRVTQGYIQWNDQTGYPAVTGHTAGQFAGNTTPGFFTATNLALTDDDSAGYTGLCVSTADMEIDVGSTGSTGMLIVRGPDFDGRLKLGTFMIGSTNAVSTAAGSTSFLDFILEDLYLNGTTFTIWAR
jgi:hypothetical protein